MSAVKELNERFGSGDAPLEPDVVSELQSIMRLYQLSEEELFYKWEEYCIKMDKADARVTLDSLRVLRQDLQDALERSNRKAAQTQPAPLYGGRNNIAGATPRAAGSAAAAADVFGMLEGLTTPSPSVAKMTRSGIRTVSTGKKRPPAGTDGAASHTPSAGTTTTTKGTRLEDRLASLGALPPAPSFQDRVGAGETIEVLNGHLPQPDPLIAPFATSRVKLTAASDLKALNYKTMAMKISDVADLLDDRIDDFIVLLMAARPDLDESSFGSAASQSTAQIVAVGRIASDAAAATAAEETGGGWDPGSAAAAAKSAKLNTSSLVLETSRSGGSGRRVHLNVSRLKGQVHFFPGQIVALKGTNASGKEFVVEEMLSLPLPPNAASTAPAMQAHRQRLKGGDDDDSAMHMDASSSSPSSTDEPRPLSIIIASGPYTADDNLDFEPLHTLCDRAAETYADVVLLAGPFLDTEHPLVASGDFSSLPDDLVASAGVDPDTATLGSLFRALVAPALGRLCATSPSTTLILLPSVRDAVAPHAAWPQDALPRRALGLHRTVRVVGNPVMINLNDCVLGASTQDVLWELRQTEVSAGGGARAGTGLDLLSRLCRHLVEQRHFFPVYPPLDRGLVPRTGASELGGSGGGGALPPGAMLDVGYLKLGAIQGVARPDMMVVPSALPAFARVVESVLFINPGFLSKRRGAGTYAKVAISASKVTDEQEASGAMVGHNVFERARVEIVKI